jgi:hypothetical protein
VIVGAGCLFYLDEASFLLEIFHVCEVGMSDYGLDPCDVECVVQVMSKLQQIASRLGLGQELFFGVRQ